MKLTIYPASETIQHQLFYTKHLLELQPETSAFAITVKTKGNLWVSYLLYDNDGEIRGEYIGPNTPQPLIINELEAYSPNTITGVFPSQNWTLEVCGAVSQNEKLTETFIEIELIEKTMDKISTLPLPSTREQPWYELGTGLFLLTDVPEKRESSLLPKWYKGDFHTHTIYSDGKMTREENLAQAQKMGLDFFVATDHNIVPTSWPVSDKVTVIPGIEVTSPHGHYNQIGVLRSPFALNGLRLLQNQQQLADSLTKKQQDLHLNSINHPFLGEWQWQSNETQLADIDLIEIWNDPTYEENKCATEKALHAWDILLTDGYPITGIGGSDAHLRPTEQYPNALLPSLIGDPATFVFSESVAVDNLLSHVKQGNVWVSRFDLTIDFTVNHAIAGTRLPLTDQAFATLKLSGTEKSYLVEWIVDGKLSKVEETLESQVSFQLDPLNYHYIRATIRFTSGELVGFTNPVYFGSKKPDLYYWKDLVQLL